MRRLRAGWALAALCGAALPARAGLFPQSPFSDGAAGTTGASFLKIPVGARMLAAGGAGAAACDNADSLFWNPAGLARLPAGGPSEAAASYNALLDTAKASALAFARPLAEGRGVFGASLLYFSQGEIEGFNRLGDPDGGFTPRDMALTAAYARAWGSLRAGGGVKLLRSELAGASGTTFALDAGLQALSVTDIGDGPLDLGLSLMNLGPPLKLGSISSPLPFVARAGSVWRMNPRFNALLDLVLPVDENPYPVFGGEFHAPLAEGLRGALRAGYNLRNGRDVDGFSGVSAGFGMELARFRLDYAWVPLGDLGTTHRISLAAKF